MGRQCDLGIGKGKRDWIQEEINAYLDFEKTEEEHVNLEEQIRLEEGYYQGRNGIQDCIDDSVLYGQARQAYFDNWNPYM
jgi:isocitrate lyase